MGKAYTSRRRASANLVMSKWLSAESGPAFGSWEKWEPARPDGPGEAAEPPKPTEPADPARARNAAQAGTEPAADALQTEREAEPGEPERVPAPLRELQAPTG